METVAENTKIAITIVGTVRAKENSKESTFITGNLVIKKPIAGVSVPTRSQLSSRNQETRLERILKS